MKQKICSLFLAISMLMSLLVASPMTASAATNGFYTYAVSNDEATITGCDTALSGVITIPSTLGGYPVTAIGDRAFAGCEGLTSIVIPNSVKTMGDRVFMNCHSLESVVIPDGITKIDDYTFCRCYSLTDVVIPDSVVSFGEATFLNCESLTSITIPNSVTTIGDMAFYGCSYRMSIYYKGTEQQWNSISIGSYNTPLSRGTVYFPYTVTSGMYTYSVFRGEAAITDCDTSASGAITIPSTLDSYPVTAIGDNAFAGCESLTSITIPDSVTTIGDSAFYSCMSLTDITIPNSVTTIGDDVFYRCTNLTNVYYTGSEIQWSNISVGGGNECLTNATKDFAIPEISVIYTYTVSDGKATITGCDTSVPSVITIPSTLDGYPVTAIGDNAFAGCESLTSITIPDSVTTIGENAFLSCRSLTSIMISSSVTRIGDGAFSGCRSLTDINVSSNNAYYSSVGGVLFNKNKTILIQHPSGKKDVAYVIPSSITTIGDYAFEYCDNLASITIPNSVTMIGEGVFSGCRSLTSITIPDSVTTIDDWVFLSCRNLTSITIPNSVTTISDWAFDGCESLTDVYYTGSENQWNNISIGTNNTYLTNATKYFAIPENGTIYTYSVFKGEATITGCDATVSGAITIPSTLGGHPVTAIGDRAFENCESLTDIAIPNSVATIGDHAFYSCGSLTGITIPNSVTTIDCSAFSYCEGLTSIVIPNSVKTMGDRLFMDCHSLESVVIPDGITRIDDYTFCRCYSLTDIVIPDSVVSFGEGVFFSCQSLTGIIIPDGTITISDSMFGDCLSLTGITIPNSVTTIGDMAFYECPYRMSIYYKGTEQQWDSISVGSYNTALIRGTIYYNYSVLGEITEFIAEEQGEGALVSIMVGNAPSDAVVWVASYNSSGKLLELQAPVLENECATATFATDEVSYYQAFVWDALIAPVCNSKVCYLQSVMQ